MLIMQWATAAPPHVKRSTWAATRSPSPLITVSIWHNFSETLDCTG